MKIIKDITVGSLKFTSEGTDTQRKVEEAVDKALAVAIPGAEYSPAFRSGHWDGKKHYYDFTTHSYPVGLTDKVVDTISDSFTGRVQYAVDDIRPDAFVDVAKLPDKLTLDSPEGKDTFILRDYQVTAVKRLFENCTGVINYSVASGKTAIAAEIIKQLLPNLHDDERIAFFTNSSDIFSQSIVNLEKFLSIKVGRLGGGKHDIRKVTVCMIPTVARAIAIDPEAKLSLNPRERITKKIANKYYQMFKSVASPRQALGNWLLMFKPKNKADTALRATLSRVYKGSTTDLAVINSLKEFVDAYWETVKKKNKDKYKKRKRIDDFLKSVVAFVADECHHSKSTTWIDVLLSCKNAIYRAGLSGSINKKDPVIASALDGIYGSIIARKKSIDMIHRGIIAKPYITMIPMTEPTTIAGLKKWQDIYKQGIVENTYRNQIVGALAAKWSASGRAVLIIVNQLAHAELLSKVLTSFNVKHDIINGAKTETERTGELNAIRTGRNKVLIATSVLDEGVDIDNIDVLLLAAGGKAPRQVIQRIGRVLRKNHNGGDKAYIYDFIDKQHRILRKHSRERLQIYHDEEYDVKMLRGS